MLVAHHSFGRLLQGVDLFCGCVAKNHRVFDFALEAKSLNKAGASG